MPLPSVLPLLLVAMLSACAAGPGRGGCGPREITLANASSMPVEQLYIGSAGTGWGEDLLVRGGSLPSGGGMALRLPRLGPGPHGLRVVWANGHAAELAGLDGCATSRITMLDTALRAE